MKNYRSIYEKYEYKSVFAKTVLESWKEPISLSVLGEKIAGPILYCYVLWVLKEAEKRNIKILYFLARDGYTLYHIALKICEKENYKIECRYLYCSRYALRLPTYALIGDEAFELLLQKSTNLTAKKLLNRVGFSLDERHEIYREIGLEGLDENNILSKAEYKKIKQGLKQSEYYKQKVIKNSKAGYDVSIGYLQQEGLLETETVAIVDSGWNCTLQRSLRQLLGSAGFQGNIVGFYFGLFSSPKDIADGEYITFYFDSKKWGKNKILFSNNILELVLSAPHRMTVTYEKQFINGREKYVPVFHGKIKNELLVEELIGGIMQFVNNVSKINISNINWVIELKLIQDLLVKMMVYPTKDEIDLWSDFSFSDDITDNYEKPFIDSNKTDGLKQYLLHNQLKRKLFGTSREDMNYQLFWIWGSIQCLPRYKRGWYRFNFCLSELIRINL